MRQQCLNHLTPAMYQLNHARRKSRLHQQLDHPRRRHRHPFRRFEDERIPRRNGERIHPQRHHRRKIKRRDPCAHPDRLSNRPAIDPLRHIVHRVAHHQRRHPARNFHHLDAALHLGHRIFEHLAVFASQNRSDFPHVLLEKRLEAIERLHAVHNRYLTPLQPCAVPVPSRAIHIRRARMGQQRQGLAVRRIDNRLRSLSLGRSPAPRNVRRSDRHIRNNSAHASSPASSVTGDCTTAPRINAV